MCVYVVVSQLLLLPKTAVGVLHTHTRALARSLARSLWTKYYECAIICESVCAHIAKHSIHKYNSMQSQLLVYTIHVLIFEWCKCDCSRLSRYFRWYSLATLRGLRLQDIVHSCFFSLDNLRECNACVCVRRFVCISFTFFAHEETSDYRCHVDCVWAKLKTHTAKPYERTEIQKHTPWWCSLYVYKIHSAKILRFLCCEPPKSHSEVFVCEFDSVQSIPCFLLKCRFYFPIGKYTHARTHTSVLCSRIPRYDSSSFIAVDTNKGQKKKKKKNKKRTEE